jgi:hypothetical protein
MQAPSDGFGRVKMKTPLRTLPSKEIDCVRHALYRSPHCDVIKVRAGHDSELSLDAHQQGLLHQRK